MNQKTLLRTAAAALILAAGLHTLAPGQTSPGSNTGAVEWRSYAADPHSTKYSPLDQINAANVKQLQVAWRWKSNNFGPRLEANMETTPLMIGGVFISMRGRAGS